MAQLGIFKTKHELAFETLKKVLKEL